MAKQTLYFKIDAGMSDKTAVQEAGRVIRSGGLVAFPTETVYGLGANALDSKAVSGIFRAKGRPGDNPLIVHISDMLQLSDVAEDITVPARRAMEALWPGPLTVVLPKKAAVPFGVTADLDTVAVRMPDHRVALDIIKEAGVPVAAPSANISGRPSPTNADHVFADLNGKIDMIIDGGPCKVGLESTVIDFTVEPPVILRPGGLSRERIEAVLGHVELDPALHKDSEQIPRSPGMKYTHYAPEAPVVLVTSEDYAVMQKKILLMVRDYHSGGKKVGVLTSDDGAENYGADFIFRAGSRACLESVAQNLFFGLRFLDEKKVDLIIVEGYPETGMGLAIMNRLRKAAGNNIISV